MSGLISLILFYTYLLYHGDPLVRLELGPVSSPGLGTPFHNDNVFVPMYMDYSSSVCLDSGHRQQTVFFPTELDWKTRACVFRNVGFDSKGRMVFHLHPQAERHSFPPFFAQHFGIELVLAYTSVYNEGYRVLNGSFVFARGHGDTNPGHVLDNVWTTFNAMNDFQFLSLDLILVLWGKASRIRHGVLKYWLTLGKSVVFIDEMDRNTLLPLVLLTTEKTQGVTFPSFTSSSVAQVFRARVGFKYGVPSHPPRVPRIGIQTKQQHHRCLNHPDVVLYLRAAFPHAVIEELEFEGSLLETEVQQMGDLTVFISPPGGGSFAASFLSSRASAIFLHVCHPGIQSSWGRAVNITPGVFSCFPLEGRLWDVFPWHKAYIHAESADELVLDDLSGDKVTKHYSYPCSLLQMETGVREALLRAGFE